ncbi:Histidine kinase [Mucilaginibacter gossypiicola]|uniref:Histidine kinase n=1 Tax=Mucilaginibacter gossypiicola TaxID=551995 RepID=A0A1H8BH36_9SPHI|nr:sensor histidine kinase [Mucilaginibacter gossypiicola]SEM81288.1 Histidine kinase [Mucilaginibacter gossypiicola]
MDSVNRVKTFNNDIILQFIIDRKYRVLRHLILVTLLCAAFYNSKIGYPAPASLYVKFSISLIVLGLLYVNMYWLVPKFLFKDNYMGYCLWNIILFGLAHIAGFYTRRLIASYFGQVVTPKEQSNWVAFYLVFTVLMGASAAVKLFQRWIIDSQRINELETATIQSELENLKKQINPHFLFNTLNNANVLIYKDPEKASEVLMKLSDLLRYQLYDSTRGKIFLSSDIHFLEDFLNLEKIRRDNFDFTITMEGGLQGVEVPPLLFITFIENAVKHNNDAEERSFVHVLFAFKGKELNFHCINSKPRIPVKRSVSGGLGLSNVKRRLELIYPERHELWITDNTETFNVHLTIKI